VLLSSHLTQNVFSIDTNLAYVWCAACVSEMLRHRDPRSAPDVWYMLLNLCIAFSFLLTCRVGQKSAHCVLCDGWSRRTANTNTHTHKHTHTQTHTQCRGMDECMIYLSAHTHTHTHTHKRARARTHTHTRTHTQTHKRARAHTHRDGVFYLQNKSAVASRAPNKGAVGI
jgi:hypothetical protein